MEILEERGIMRGGTKIVPPFFELNCDVRGLSYTHELKGK